MHLPSEHRVPQFPRPVKSAAPPGPRGHGATIVHAPGGLLLVVHDPERAELVADRLARWIPRRARTRDTARGAWTVVAPFDRTARAVALVSTGTILELWAKSYAAAWARLDGAAPVDEARAAVAAAEAIVARPPAPAGFGERAVRIARGEGGAA